MTLVASTETAREFPEDRMLTMTETAAKKISELRLEEGKREWGLRIRGVVGRGRAASRARAIPPLHVVRGRPRIRHPRGAAPPRRRALPLPTGERRRRRRHLPGRHGAALARRDRGGRRRSRRRRDRHLL